MPISPGDVMKVTAVISGPQGQDVMNVYRFRFDGLTPIADSLASDDLADFIDDLYDLVDGLIVDNAAFSTIQLFNETQDRPLSQVGWPTLTSGGNTSDPTAPGVAALVRLVTGVSRVVGRKYLGVLGEDTLTNGLLETTPLTALASFGAFLIGGFLGSSSLQAWLPGVVDLAGNFWAFTEAVVSQDAAYQRRRRPGRGS